MKTLNDPIDTFIAESKRPDSLIDFIKTCKVDTYGEFSFDVDKFEDALEYISAMEAKAAQLPKEPVIGIGVPRATYSFVLSTLTAAMMALREEGYGPLPDLCENAIKDLKETRDGK